MSNDPEDTVELTEEERQRGWEEFQRTHNFNPADNRAHRYPWHLHMDESDTDRPTPEQNEPQDQR